MGRLFFSIISLLCRSFFFFVQASSIRFPLFRSIDRSWGHLPHAPPHDERIGFSGHKPALSPVEFHFFDFSLISFLPLVVVFFFFPNPFHEASINFPTQRNNGGGSPPEEGAFPRIPVGSCYSSISPSLSGGLPFLILGGVSFPPDARFDESLSKPNPSFPLRVSTSPGTNVPPWTMFALLTQVSPHETATLLLVLAVNAGKFLRSSRFFGAFSEGISLESLSPPPDR